MTTLEQSWSRAWKGVGARGAGESLFDQLVALYGEPRRKYHSLQHLRECLAAFDTVRGLPPHPGEVEMALWFHDAIHDFKGSDNEERSAVLARSALIEAGAPAESARLVHSLVLATQHAMLPATLDEQVLVDIDLAIFGASTERFAEYEAQIREEYAHVPGGIFKQKRRAILQSFLDRLRIYSTAHFHGLLEKQARENLKGAVGT